MAKKPAKKAAANKFYLGPISGAVFGLVGVVLSTLGLISLSMEVLSPLFFPAAIPFKMAEANFSGMMIVAVLLNMLVFAMVGYFIQQFLRENKKNEKIVLYAFGGIVLLAIIAIVIESFTHGLSA